ncbi:MAG: alpha/beta hydrolase [Bacteroidetes bacterium]|nr:MAG: alpha/beta hydrolase [Bacteroidota bacterium]
MSDKPDEEKYTYSLFEHADIALQVWKHVGVRGGHLLGHDMGDSVCTELLARHVQNILPGWFSGGFQSFTFTNGSMVVELAHLRIMQKVLLSPFGKWLGWLSTYPVFRHQVRSAHGNDTLGEQDIERLWENLTLQNGHRKNHLLIRYYKDRIRFERPRWLPALRLAGVPVHFCWGEDDQVAQMPMPHYLQKNYCPAATVTIMPGVGHFCQLGSPTLWVEKVGDFYKKIRT